MTEVLWATGAFTVRVLWVVQGLLAERFVMRVGVADALLCSW